MAPKRPLTVRYRLPDPSPLHPWAYASRSSRSRASASTAAALEAGAADDCRLRVEKSSVAIYFCDLAFLNCPTLRHSGPTVQPQISRALPLRSRDDSRPLPCQLKILRIVFRRLRAGRPFFEPQPG